MISDKILYDERIELYVKQMFQFELFGALIAEPERSVLRCWLGTKFSVQTLHFDEYVFWTVRSAE